MVKKKDRPAEDAEHLLPAGPGLRRRWLVAGPVGVAGLLLPVVIASVLAVWENWASRTVTLADAVGDVTPPVAALTGIGLVIGIIAMLVNRFEVTSWPQFGAWATCPALFGLVVVGMVATKHGNPLFLLDLPGAVALGVGSYTVLRFGVRQLAEPAALDNLLTRLDVRVPRQGGGSVLLRHDRLVIISGRPVRGRAYSWYDFRYVRVNPDDDGELEVVTVEERYTFPADQAEIPVIRAAIRQRAHHLRGQSDDIQQRAEHQRDHENRGRAARIMTSRLTSQDRGGGVGMSFMGLVYLFMVVGPVGAVVLTVLAIQASTPDQRTQAILAAVADTILGLLAHLKFWRLRAARRYLETHPDD